MSTETGGTGGGAQGKPTTGRDPVAESPDVTQDPDDEFDQDSGPTTTAPPGERPTDPRSAAHDDQASTD